MYITKSRLVVIGLVVIGLICLTYAWAQHQNEGDKPYTPTRLEWLAVVLNSGMSVSFENMSMRFVPVSNNTLKLLVSYSPRQDRAYLNIMVNVTKRSALNIAEGYGFDTWLKIKEEIKMIE